ncbi:hypothetical protein KR222_009081 [Zaprionus bogoriensis]|nr:hypothetical protein KR222_009081 [Zaprionus bogoriensis]
MAHANQNVMAESHWVNWCRLCSKDDTSGNVKINSSEHGNAWNSVMLLAIRKYFDVHMRLEDELSGVLCKECYTLISELIDFAEHVTKVQAIFEVLRRSEPNKQQLDVQALRCQYGLREGDWTHIIKPVSEMDSSALKQAEHGLESACLQVPKQEFIDLSEAIEIEQPKPLESCEEAAGKQLPIEEILIAGWDAADGGQDKPIKRPRGRRRANKLLDADPIKKRALGKVEPLEAADTERSNTEMDPTSAEEAAVQLLPEVASPTAAEVPFVDYSSSSERDDADVECSTKRRNMECSWCGKLYHNPTSYQKHLQLGCRRVEQRTKLDKNTYCELCNKTLSSAAALRMHKEGMHDNAKPFICDHCGKQLKTITALNEHKLVHTDERPFSCAICRAGFKNRARLKVHYQIHEEPSFICNICGKKLQTRRTWNMHKLVHSEERKFKCDVCGALFKRSKTLKTHLLSHTGLRPYVCNYCGQTFACNANCRAHKVKKHPNELKKEEGEGLSSRLSVPTLDELRVM